MRFFVTDSRETLPRIKPYPFVMLATDYWDDYSFKTLFHPVIHLSEDESVDLRDVKILRLNQPYGRTEIEQDFVELDDSYCSLGQELAYYESLLTLPDNIRSDYLNGLRDAAADPTIRDRFEGERGFHTSLLRWGSAARALEDALGILQGGKESDYELEFTFYTRFGSNEFGTPFRYCEVPGLPGRINAVIGYNGTGKTQLLANLAWVARADLQSRGQDSKIAQYGRLDPADLRFGSVVAVSYSAFDTFELPWRSDEDNQFGYTYCGLRRQTDQGTSRGLKDAEEIANDIKAAVVRIDTPSRRKYLTEALQPLRDEPSFKRAGYELDLLAANGSWSEEFSGLSTGHKISINIIVQLVAALQQRSLVLIDEPEAHLHPPLLAALMKGIGIALEAHGSYAVIATHSPVVLQEIAGCYAHVLRRHGSQNSVEEPDIETFGENIGLLTRHVFNLDNSQSDYVGVLRELALELSLEKIEGLFEHGLSSQARALVMQALRE